MRLNLQSLAANHSKPESETFESALDYLFPERPLTEQELFEEFNRLFPPS
jgi:hypothetical protein